MLTEFRNYQMFSMKYNTYQYFSASCIVFIVIDIGLYFTDNWRISRHD